MEALNNNNVLQFHPDALEYIRKQYDLDGPGRMSEAVDILEEWLKKQDHFTVKTFPRGVLERIIINNKGSLEASKRKLDRACTFRTVLPDFFGTLNLEEYEGYKAFTHTLLAKMTPEYGRLLFVKSCGESFDLLINCFKYFVLICEYIQTNDYNTGLTYIVDCRDLNITEFIKCANFLDMKKAIDISIEGYSTRVKGIHLISDSSAVDMMVALLRKLFKAKIGQRIYCHKSLGSLHEAVPRECLPQEYGGKDNTVPELRDKLLNELRSPKFVEHCKHMNTARTNEDCRSTADFIEEHLGMPGTFRALTVD